MLLVLYEVSHIFHNTAGTVLIMKIYRERSCSCSNSQPMYWNEVNGYPHIPAALSPGNEICQGVCQSRSERFAQKNLLNMPGFEPRIIHPVT